MDKQQAKVRRSTSNAHNQDVSNGSFFGPAIQTKLTVNEPGDRYEQEADAVADQVMRKPSDADGLIASNSVPVVSSIQRKCAECEKEDKLQRKEGEEDDNSVMTKLQGGEMPNIQRLPFDCEKFKKKEEDIDAEDATEAGVAVDTEPAGSGGGGGDEEESESDDEPVQRKCAACENEEVHRKESDSGSKASRSLESGLQSSKGGGSSLPEESRSFFENKFGADFSGVRIHNDSSAAVMSSSINAHAFTHGSDIYFNSGQYSSSSESGQKLLAHELTHVVQQGGAGVQTKKQSTPTQESSHIQRSFYFTAKPPRVKGKEVHKAVLPEFVAANPDIFMEVSIPGATKKDVDKGKTGVADLYKATRTIGIKMDGEPKAVNANKDFRAGTNTKINGKEYRHRVDSAPRGAAYTPRVQNLDMASPEIEIADLKPVGSEASLGEAQVKNYIDGINNTKTDVNNYVAANPTQANSTTKVWKVNPVPMKSLNPPKSLTYTQGSGLSTMKNRPLEMRREGSKRPYVEHVGFTGTLYVYKDKPPGVWTYEWIPDDVPATTGSKEANTIIDRLNKDVIPALKSTNGTAIGPKRAPAGYYVQRKDGKFSDEEWKKKYFTPWKTDTTKFLGNKTEVKKAEVAQGVTDVEKRSGLTVKAPQEVKDQGKNLPKVKHWKRFGGFYGWLREKFDVIYVKVKAFVDKIKKKVADFSKKSAGSAFGGWFKAFVRVVFKILKMVGSWVVSQVMDKILNSLRDGIMKNVNTLIDKLTPESAKDYLDKFCKLQDKYDKIIAEKEDELATLVFGDKLKVLDAIEELESKISWVGDIVTLIEWGIRLLACASPPAIGCLWNLVESAIRWAFAKLMETCWFTKEVYAPIINKVDFVKNFPAQIASGLVDEFNKHLPVPDGLDKWFTPIDVKLTDFKPDCNEAGDGSGKLTADRKAIWDMVKPSDNEPDPAPDGEPTATGKNDQKLKTALEMMKKRGAGPWVLLTKERAEKLKAAMENASPEQMLDAAKDKNNPIPESMTEIMKDVSTYTPAEQKLISEHKARVAEKAEREAYEKALEEIKKDPKAAAALATPYPSESDLQKDLEGFTGWSGVTAIDPIFIRINGHTVVLMRTRKGSRLGAFFKFYEKTKDGVTRNVVLETSDYYVLDDIEAFDSIGFIFTNLDGSGGSLVSIGLVSAVPGKKMITGLGNHFFNVSVHIR